MSQRNALGCVGCNRCDNSLSLQPCNQDAKVIEDSGVDNVVEPDKVRELPHLLQVMQTKIPQSSNTVTLICNADNVVSMSNLNSKTNMASLYGNKSILNSDVEKVMISFCKNTALPWKGTPTELYNEVLKTAKEVGVRTDKYTAFPVSPAAFSRKLGEILPTINKAGYNIFARTEHVPKYGNSQRQISIFPIEA